MTDLDKLEALAKAATPGPWRGDRIDGTVKYDIVAGDYPNGEYTVVCHGDNGNASDGGYGFTSAENEDYVLATDPTTVLALIAEVRALREDKARLDWLDGMNAALNRHYGTTYQWKVILSPNITRLNTGQWAGYVGDIDLNDAQCGEGSFDGCRKAIDAVRGAK